MLLCFALFAGLMAAAFDMAAEDVLLLRGGCMLLSLVIPFTQLSKRNATPAQVGICRPSLASHKAALYYAPALLSLLPPLLGGVGLRSLCYILALCVYCLSVAVAGELYFRGVIYNILERRYPYRQAILLGSLLFAIAHSVGLPGGALSLYTLLQTLNGLLLGIIAAELRRRGGSLYPGIFYHAAFVFANHISLAAGSVQLILAGLQAAVMAGYVVYLWVRSPGKAS